MAEIPLTPEEKLLRIIESPAGSVASRRPVYKIQDFKLSLKLLKAKYGEKINHVLNLKTTNSFLIVVVVLMTIFLALDFWMGLPRLSVVNRIENAGRSQNAAADMTVASLEPVAVYLQEIIARNIFALPESSSASAGEATAKTQPQAPKKDLSGELKVVGIIWSAAPQVIIEDAKEGKTHLLNRGGKIRDGRIKEILKDRVILSYDNQEIELK